ncbi:MAG: hypothetical protein H7Y89_12280 [Steroidobacteraceae bacterium]|nr:hypothetical protein [Steroidobacteraceae bacterium]
MDSAQMRFPVFRINEEHIQKFVQLSDLRPMSIKDFERGSAFRNAFFIDADGRQFVILGAKLRRKSYHIKFWFAPSTVHLVDFDVAPPRSLGFEQTKQILSKRIVGRKWYGQGGESRAQFCERFDRIADMDELFDSMSFYGRWQG